MISLLKRVYVNAYNKHMYGGVKRESLNMKSEKCNLKSHVW